MKRSVADGGAGAHVGGAGAHVGGAGAHVDVCADTDRRVRQRDSSNSASDPCAIPAVQSTVADTSLASPPSHTFSNSSIGMSAVSSISCSISGGGSSFSSSSGFTSSSVSSNDRVTSSESEEHTETRSSTATNASSSSLSNKLHRHALESIFSFFGLKELVAALHVSHNWCAAVSSMARLNLTCDYAVSMRTVSLSGVSRHIYHLGGKLAGFDSDHCSPSSSVVIDSVFDSAQFPQLQSLSCRVEYDGEEPLTLPSTLTDINMDIKDESQQRALEAVSRLPLLRMFEWYTAGNAYASFACLAACPNLRSLFVDTSDLHPDFVNDVRLLPHLTELRLWGFEDQDQLEDLFRLPCQMPWKRIRFYHANPEMDSRNLELLARLPFLDTLDSPLDTERLDFLHQMPNLTYLDLFLAHGLTNTPDEVIEAIASCSLVQVLRLTEGCGLTDVHLNKLLPRLPVLEQLLLQGIPLSSLSFLAQAPMVQKLSTLHIHSSHMDDDVDGATISSPDEFRYLQELRGLCHLKLLCLTPQCEEVALERFTVPSQLMPWLESFRC